MAASVKKAINEGFNDSPIEGHGGTGPRTTSSIGKEGNGLGFRRAVHLGRTPVRGPRQPPELPWKQRVAAVAPPERRPPRRERAKRPRPLSRGCWCMPQGGSRTCNRLRAPQPERPMRQSWEPRKEPQGRWGTASRRHADTSGGRVQPVPESM